MSRDDPSRASRAEPDDVYDVEPPVTLSEALGEDSRPDLGTVAGVGDVFAVRLHRHGVTTPGEVAEMDVEQLAEVLETSAGRAANIREAAAEHVAG